MWTIFEQKKKTCIVLILENANLAFSEIILPF